MPKGSNPEMVKKGNQAVFPAPDGMDRALQSSCDPMRSYSRRSNSLNNGRCTKAVGFSSQTFSHHIIVKEIQIEEI